MRDLGVRAFKLNSDPISRPFDNRDKNGCPDRPPLFFQLAFGRKGKVYRSGRKLDESFEILHCFHPVCDNPSEWILALETARANIFLIIRWRVLIRIGDNVSALVRGCILAWNKDSST